MRLKDIRQKVEVLNTLKSPRVYEFGKKDIYGDKSNYMFWFTVNENGKVIKELCTTDRKEIVIEIEKEAQKGKK